jgi:uncharacterized membrane protein YciS (DUF1049 family)
MLALAQYHLPTLVSALLIGVATGWWIFRNRRRRPSDTNDTP